MTRCQQPGEPPCYWRPFHVSTVTLRGRELKLFLKGELLRSLITLILYSPPFGRVREGLGCV